jgi:hypothetical protein
MLRIPTAYASVKNLAEAKFAELPKNAVAVPASHQTKLVAAAHGGKNLAGTGD